MRGAQPEVGSRYDAIVVGAGIAGSSLALALAGRGHSVLLLDRARFPRDKPCGEGIMPDGVGTLQRLELAETVLARGARPFRELALRSPRGAWAVAPFPDTPDQPSYGLVMRRRELDQALFERAAAHPRVTARDGVRVSALWREGGRVGGVVADPRAAGEPCRLAATVTVGADGLHSLFHAACGLGRALLRRRRFGVTGHLRGIEGQADRVEVLIQREGEIYVAPGPGGLTLVALLLEAWAMRPFRGDVTGAYEHFVRDAPGLRGRMAGAELVPPVTAVGPLGFTLDRVHGDGFLLVGDAAGFLDPISGMGMSLALKSVEVAVPVLSQAIETGDVSAAALAPYAERRERAVEDAVQWTRLLLRLSRRRWAVEWVVHRLGRHPERFSRLLGLASGATRYRDLHLSEKLALLGA
ncbi:MAG: NAD(P)/FAD-dependent oxidoreductase [Gemmatimonadota bacterium]